MDSSFSSARGSSAPGRSVLEVNFQQPTDFASTLSSPDFLESFTDTTPLVQGAIFSSSPLSFPPPSTLLRLILHRTCPLRKKSLA